MTHPYKKLCKHAIEEINHKYHYTQKEFDDCSGLCWKCDRKLTLGTATNALIRFEDIHMSKPLREEMVAKGQEYIDKYIAEINAPCVYYTCFPCWKEMINERLKLPAENYTKLEDIIKDLKDPEGEWYQKKLQLIKEVEECGLDCPLYSSLEWWKQEIETRFDELREN